jgi:hypothetical protein
MQIIRDPATTVADPELRTLVSRVFACVSDCPEILGFILVVEPGDTLAALETQLGFSVIEGRQEFIQEHDHWFELVYVTGQDGYGIEVFLPKSEGIDPDLLLMCQRYASPGNI